jgi:hypothetical protein
LEDCRIHEESKAEQDNVPNSIRVAKHILLGLEETRRSVLGQVNTLGGVLLNMTSKKQRSVTLSNREAELVAGIECANEAMFQSMLLEEVLC